MNKRCKILLLNGKKYTGNRPQKGSTDCNLYDRDQQYLFIYLGSLTKDIHIALHENDQQLD